MRMAAPDEDEISNSGQWQGLDGMRPLGLVHT